MAKKFLTGLRLVNLSSDPASGQEGELYFNTSASIAKIYKNGSWADLDTVGGGSLTQEQIQDYVAPLFTSASGTNVVAIYDDANNVINLNTSGSLISVDSIVYPDYITFDTTPETSSNATGTIFWDSGDGLLKANLNANVELGIGQESVALVKNTTGSTIAKGKVVYINGAAGQRPTIALSDADTEVTSSKTFGFTAEEILDEAEGFVVTEGILRGVNTNGLTEGGAIWLSSTAGGFTQTMPTQPSHGVFLGYVVKANPSSGEIFVKIQNGYELQELHNVLITSASVQQALVYDSDGLWKNQYIVNSVNGTSNQIIVDNSGIGDVTFSLSNDLITPGNLTVTGNLTVSGSTTYINTQTLNVEDNIITLNSNVTGAPTGTAGIEIERGTETNSSILWTESLQGWDFSHDIYTNAVRNQNILELNVSASAGSSGEIDLLTDFAELNINSDGSIDLRPGNISGFERYKFTKTHLEFPDLSQQDTAFLGMSSYTTTNLSEGTNLYFTNQRAIDALSSTLTNYLTNSSASTIYLTQANAASIYLTQANASTTYLTTETDPIFVASDAYNITSASTSAWNTAYGWGNHALAGYSLTSHNHSLNSLSNVVITGTPTDGQAIVWDTSTSKWVNETVSGGASYPDQTGNNGKFLQTNGASVSWQNIDFTGYLTESSASSTYLTQASASSTYQPIGSYLTSESDTLETVTDRGATSSNAISITNATAASSTTTGALTVTGGVGIGEDLYVNNNVYIGGDINITGSISGSLTYVNVTDLVVTDPLIYLAEGNPNDSVDIGIFAALNHSSSAYYHTGLIRDASDSGKWKLASNLLDPTSNVIDFTGATFDTLKIGALEVVDSSTTRTNLGLVIGTDVQAYNATLAAVAGGTYSGDDSITTLGTISSGTWNGVTIGYQYGGTGLTSLGSAGYVLAVNGTATGLEWVAMSGGGSSFTNSSELAALLSDETGSGSAVFATSPTITTPVISGGTINNASIGATTASTGKFTSVNLNGQAIMEASTGTSSATSSFNTTVYSSAEFIVYGSTSTGNYVSKVLMLARGTATPVITEYAILTQGTAPTVTITPSYSAPNAVLTVAVTSGTNIEIIATEVSI